MLVITDDVSEVKVGEDNRCYEQIMIRHGIGRLNDNEERLCEFCDMNCFHIEIFTKPPGYRRTEKQEIK